MKICVASGKGGTGKTTVAVNLACAWEGDVCLLDCDVEEPNANLFLKGDILKEEICNVKVPKIDEKLCNGCGKCDEICEFKAIIVIENIPMTFYELCHSCGACVNICPQNAIFEINRRIGVINHFKKHNINLYEGRLDIGVAMAPPLIKFVKQHAKDNEVVIIDAPPGTSCPTITAMKDSDFIILVTEPTPFGLNDLRLAVEVTRELKIPFGVIVNKWDIGDEKLYNYLAKEDITILMEIKHDLKIAKLYSRGEILVNCDINYKKAFQRLRDKVLDILENK